MTVARAFAHASAELIEQMGVDPQDIAVMQRAFLLDQLDLRLLAIEKSARYLEAYRLTIEGEGLPPGHEIELEYIRENDMPRLVRWR